MCPIYPCLVGHTLKKPDMRSRLKPQVLRGKLLINGYTIRAFAEQHSFSERTVKAAIRGERKGPVTQKILEAIGHVTK